MNDAITITASITERIKSPSLTARTLPNKYELMLDDFPDAEEITIPNASATDEATAIAVSPAVRYFLLMYIMMNDAAITDGEAIYIG